jgi:dienelactone hydrolase
MLASLLASRGYPTLDLAYFGAPDLPSRLERIPIEYFEKALRWLAARPEVDPQRVFVLGRSRGAELALLLGTMFPSLVYGVAAYSPSSVVNPAPDGTTAAWTYEGRAVPPFGPMSSGMRNPPEHPRRSFLLNACAALSSSWPAS